MSQSTTILLVIAMGILALSLVYTWMLAKGQRATKGQVDTKIPSAVQEHPYLRNPVFLAYIFFFLLVITLIIFVAQTSNW